MKLGVVLFSDGLNNSGSSINKAVSELKRRKIPVYTISLGQDRYQGNIVDGIIEEEPRADPLQKRPPYRQGNRRSGARTRK